VTGRKKKICQPRATIPLKGGRPGKRRQGGHREEGSLPEAGFEPRIGYIAVISSRWGKPEVLLRPEFDLSLGR
jgi:hypothetical protein